MPDQPITRIPDHLIQAARATSQDLVASKGHRVVLAVAEVLAPGSTGVGNPQDPIPDRFDISKYALRGGLQIARAGRLDLLEDMSYGWSLKAAHQACFDSAATKVHAAQSVAAAEAVRYREDVRELPDTVLSRKFAVSVGMISAARNLYAFHRDLFEDVEGGKMSLGEASKIAKSELVRVREGDELDDHEADLIMAEVEAEQMATA